MSLFASKKGGLTKEQAKKLATIAKKKGGFIKRIK